MDSELFTVGGVLGRKDLMVEGKALSRDNVDVKDVQFAQVKLMRSWRWVGNALYTLLVIGSIVMFLAFVLPESIAWWKYATTQHFTQKEGLQYLGASTNVTRDDTGWPSSLSPDEQKYLAEQTAITAEAKKATFMAPREHYTEHATGAKLETPEEKLLKKQQSSHM